MSKGFRQIANNSKAERLPKPHRALIRAHDQIKLHGSESPGSGEFQGMLAHHAGNSAPRCIRGGDVSTIGDMRAASRLIRAQVISADHSIVVFRDKSFTIGAGPVSDRLRLRHIPRQRVRLACANDGLDDGPYRGCVTCPCVLMSKAINPLFNGKGSTPQVRPNYNRDLIG
ncbi:MAG: hypothetical protein JWM97_55 [Phycisphaerales bacterium]|nr:hypothetical protein [Phycisphaerales bacterium]